MGDNSLHRNRAFNPGEFAPFAASAIFWMDYLIFPTVLERQTMGDQKVQYAASHLKACLCKRALLRQQSEPLRRQPVSKSPNGHSVKVDCRKQLIRRPTRHGAKRVLHWITPDVQRNPDRFHRFMRIHYRRQFAIYFEHTRSDQMNGPALRLASTGGNVASLCSRPKLDSTLFFKFAEGSMQQVGVGRFTPAAGKRPVSRPGIFMTLRATDEQYGSLGCAHARSLLPLRVPPYP